MSIDSRFADQSSHGTGDFTIRMPTVFKNIQRIALSSTEIPLVEYLFSTTHGNINFSVTVGATTTQASIAEGNYSSCQLVAELQNVLQGIDPNFSVTLDSNTGLLTITNTTSPFLISLISDNLTIAQRPTHWGLGYFLGFRTKTPLSSTMGPMGPYTLTGCTIVLVQPTTYYLLQLGCPDQVENITHCLADRTSVKAFAKLQLDEDVYVINFNNNADYLRKEYTFLSPINVTQIRARLLDPYGCTVNMRCMDWSFTIELYEVVNSRTYAHMGLTYER